MCSDSNTVQRKMPSGRSGETPGRRIHRLVLACAIVAVCGASRAADTGEPRSAPPSTPLHLVVFYSPGCPDCRRVDAWLDDLTSLFPGLVIHRYDVNDPDSMRLNEALCERFGIQEKERLTAPAVFTASGALTRSGLNSYDALADLVATAVATSGDDAGEGKWWRPPAPDLQAADQRIHRRFLDITLGVVLAAGLLDGLNPCAFATLVFLLSYLQLRGGRPSRVLAGGAMFAAGVFAAYFATGLGLLGALRVAGGYRWPALGVRWTMAILVLVLALLSLRDAVLCLQGRVRQMTLQLPAGMKRSAHAVIRRGALGGWSHFGMFVMGAAVSFLELACTGQVYAPTLQYVVQQGVDRRIATWYLAAYNAAFIAPLLAVLIIAWCGVRSRTLAQWLERHAAVIKFALAALFLLLFGVLTGVI